MALYVTEQLVAKLFMTNEIFTMKNVTPKNVGKILIVDDEGDICYLLSTFFKHENFETDQVNTLAQAEVHIRENTPDLVFLDNHLPDGQGIKMIDKLKAAYPLTR
ncbi:MAG: response regulator, partial [Chitinophagaceae bacterium]